MERSEEEEAVMGGSSCSNVDSTNTWHGNGTIGMVFMHEGQGTVISAMTVLAENSESILSQKIVTPSMQRGAVYPKDFIGFTTKGLYGGDSNSDIAIATLQKPLHKDFKYNYIQSIGDIKGYADAKVMERVRKFGAGSGYTEGVVSSVTFSTPYGNIPVFPQCTLTDLLLINPTEKGEFAIFGDTGSYIVNNDNMVVGMLLGFEEGFAYAMPSKNILKFLQS